MNNSTIKSNGALTALLTFTLFSIAFAQTLAASAQSDVSLRVDQLFTRFDRPDSPGCALGVIRDGKLIYKKGHGMANMEHDIPISPATVFNVASASTQFTAMSVLLLARQGKLNNLRSGEIVWQQRGFAMAQLVAADEKLILLDEDGTVALVEPTPKELRVLAKTSVLQNTAWTPPTLAGVKLYLRDRKTLMALNLAAK